MDRTTLARVALATGEAAIAVAFAAMAVRCWTEAIELWSDGALFRRFLEWATLPANTTATIVAALPKGGAVGSALRMAAAVPVAIVAALLTYGTCEGVVAALRRLAPKTTRPG